MKLTDALLSVMQLVASLVPHAKMSATSNCGEEGGRVDISIEFRGGVGFGVSEGEILVSTFIYQLEQLRKEISRIIFLIIPQNLLSGTMREAIVNMDKVVIEVWYDSNHQIETGSLLVTVNGKELELDLKEEYQIDRFPKMHWDSLISALSNFNHGVMTDRGPCYRTTE